MLFNKSKQLLQAGLSVHRNGLAVAVIKQNKNKPPELVDFGNVSVDQGGPYDDAIKEISKKYRLSKTPCVCVLEPESYSLLQMESPEVQADEMQSALKWKISDLIDFHPDDATIDLFELPKSARNGATKMMNVVVARTSVVQQHVDLLHAAGIEPLAIDIVELALRNIGHAEMTPEDEPRAVMHLLPENVFIEISDQKMLYLSRNISIGSSSGSWNDESGYEMLILEMQRSMDFYESNYGKGPASELRIYQRPDDKDTFIEYAREQLSIRIVTRSLSDTLPGVEKVEEHALPVYLPAIGAALRAA